MQRRPHSQAGHVRRERQPLRTADKGNAERFESSLRSGTGETGGTVVSITSGTCPFNTKMSLHLSIHIYVTLRDGRDEEEIRRQMTVLLTGMPEGSRGDVKVIRETPNEYRHLPLEIETHINITAREGADIHSVREPLNATCRHLPVGSKLGIIIQRETRAEWHQFWIAENGFEWCRDEGGSRERKV